MKPSRTFWVVLSVAVGVLFLVAAQSLTRPPSTVDARKIMAAAQTYRAQLQAAGRPLPIRVPLQELVARGLLEPKAMMGFAEMDPSIVLVVLPDDPEQVLMALRLPGGGEMVALNDGSVRVIRR